MSRWKLRDHRITSRTIELTAKSSEGERKISVDVDELGYFELKEVAPPGLNAFAEAIG